MHVRRGGHERLITAPQYVYVLNDGGTTNYVVGNPTTDCCTPRAEGECVGDSIMRALSQQMALLVQLLACARSVLGDVFSDDPILADLRHYNQDCKVQDDGELVCAQREAPAEAIRVGCIGDSITAVGHTSGTAHHWPNQLQDILDNATTKGKFSVSNLGICGTTLSDHGASPWWKSPAYRALVSAKWDKIFIMLGTNDARDVGSGGPEHWPRATCDDATAATLRDCSFATNYTALLDVVKNLGTPARGAAGPEVHIMIPPPLMEQGAYGMNQTIINTVFPRLVPLIAKAHSSQVKSVIDIYTGMGGVPAPAWKTEMPPKCVLNSTWPPCAWYCDAQSCAPGQCHPNDVPSPAHIIVCNELRALSHLGF